MKTNKFTRLLSLVLVLAMCVSMIPVKAHALDGPYTILSLSGQDESTKVKWAYLVGQLMLAGVKEKKFAAQKYKLLNSAGVEVAKVSVDNVDSSVYLNDKETYTFQAGFETKVFGLKVETWSDVCSLTFYVRYKPNIQVGDGVVNYYDGMDGSALVGAIKDAIYRSSAAPKDSLSLWYKDPIADTYLPVTSYVDLIDYLTPEKISQVNFRLGCLGGYINGSYYDPDDSSSAHITLIDPRALPTINVKDGVVNYYSGMDTSGISLQTFVNAIYNGGDIQPGDLELAVLLSGQPVVLDSVDLALYYAAKGEKFALKYKGNSVFQPRYSSSVKVSLVDPRADVQIYAKNGSIDYYLGMENDVANPVKLADLVHAIYAEGNTIPESEMQLAVKIEGVLVPLTDDDWTQYITAINSITDLSFYLYFPGNAAYKSATSANSVKITFHDPRATAELLVKNGVVDYYPGMEEDVENPVKLTDLVHAIYAEGNTIPESEVRLGVKVKGVVIPLTDNDWLEYITSIDSITDLDYYLVFSGNAAYKPAVSANSAKITFNDPRPDANILAQNGQVRYNPEEVSDMFGLHKQDFVDAIYAGGNIPKDKLELYTVIEDIPVPVTSKEAAFAAAVAGADFYLYFKGGKVDGVNYKPGFSQPVKIQLVDIRLDTVMEVSEETLTITYGDDLYAAIVEAGLVAVKPADETDETVITLTRDNVSFDPEVPNASTLPQTVKIKFKGATVGENIYKGCTGEISVIVKKAPSTMDVKSKKVGYDGNPHKLEIRTNTDYIAITAGIDGTAKGFLSMDFGGSTEMVSFLLTLMGVDPDEGISLPELAAKVQKAKDKLENPDWFTEFALKLISVTGGQDIIDTLNRILNILDQLPLEDINAVIYVGKDPVNAGLYETTAITVNPNYETSMDVATLTIVPQTSKTVKLQWNQELPKNTVLTWTEARNFDFGCTLVDVEGNAHSDVVLVQSVSGVNFDGTVINNAEMQLQPGVYTQTVVGYGNYIPKPVTRVYTVKRQNVDLVGEKMVVVSDGSPKDVQFTVITEDGSAETAEAVKQGVKIMYTGVTDKGMPYSSNVAPTEPGIYSALIAFESTEELEGAVKTIAIEITTPEPSRAASIVRSIVNIFKKK